MTARASERTSAGAMGFGGGLDIWQESGDRRQGTGNTNLIQRHAGCDCHLTPVAGGAQMAEDSSRADKRCWTVSDLAASQPVTVSHGLLAGATGVISLIPGSR